MTHEGWGRRAFGNSTPGTSRFHVHHRPCRGALETRIPEAPKNLRKCCRKPVNLRELVSEVNKMLAALIRPLQGSGVRGPGRACLPALEPDITGGPHRSLKDFRGAVVSGREPRYEHVEGVTGSIPCSRPPIQFPRTAVFQVERIGPFSGRGYSQVSFRHSVSLRAKLRGLLGRFLTSRLCIPKFPFPRSAGFPGARKSGSAGCDFEQTRRHCGFKFSKGASKAAAPVRRRVAESLDNPVPRRTGSRPKGHRI